MKRKSGFNNRSARLPTSDLYPVFRLLAKEMLKLHAIAENLNLSTDFRRAKKLEELKTRFVVNTLIIQETMRRPIHLWRNVDVEWTKLDSSNLSEVLVRFYGQAYALCGHVSECIPESEQYKPLAKSVDKIERQLHALDERIRKKISISPEKLARMKRARMAPIREPKVVNLQEMRKLWGLDKQ